tara:strand:- start:1156 stop:2409 length:1254 start_codon:yes stop_codon:yes gene_type:complete
MSNNLDIGGVLANLLNYGVDSLESVTSTKNLEPVSLSTALNRSHVREQNNNRQQSRNPTKKAIVLQPVAGTPTAATPEEKTTWLNSALAILTGYGATPEQAETMTATYAANFPEYWVWVLPDGIENVGVIPAFQGTSTVFNVERFTKCVINDAAIEVELLQGACVRIDYENRRLRGGAYVVNIVNNEQDFANAVIKELEGIPSAGAEFGACDERGVSVRHPSGDSVGTHGEGSAVPSTAADIKRAYPQVAAVEGFAEKIVTVAASLSIPDPGWLANVMYFESGKGFDPGKVNPIGCVGLIQFCGHAGAGADAVGKTTTELAAMSHLVQMDYVEIYLNTYKGRLNTSADLYMSIYFPVAVGRGPSYNIYNWYVQNKSARSAQKYLSDNGGIRTSGDYQALADRSAKLPTHLTPSGAVA